MGAKKTTTSVKVRYNDGHLIIDGAKTLGRYKELTSRFNKCDSKVFEMVCGYDAKDVKSAKKAFEKKVRKLGKGEYLTYFGCGAFATKEGYTKGKEYVNATCDMISRECDQQEVYYYEYIALMTIEENCDKYAFGVVKEYFGSEVAKTVKRLRKN